MYMLAGRRRLARLGLAALAFAFELTAAPLPTGVALAQSATPPAAASQPAGQPSAQPAGCDDYPVPGGWFYTQEAKRFAAIASVVPCRAPGYLVVDDERTGNFWTEFRRYGGVDVLGYPVSQPYHYPGEGPNGYWYQAFERGILQYHPETGRAELANVFEQFTAAGLDAELEFHGIPTPQPLTDPNLRMGLLTEPRFLARYFFDPIPAYSSQLDLPAQSAFTNEAQAQAFFGLPQTGPQQLYMRTAPNGTVLYPWLQPFLAQRFQKGGMQLFLGSSTSLDPTIVPGDAVPGCVAVTAVGLLARTVGIDRLIPSSAIQPLPTIPGTPPPFFTVYVAPVSPGQSTVAAQLSGTGYAPNEPITIHWTPVPTATATLSATILSPSGSAAASTTGSVVPSAGAAPVATQLTSHVAAANHDGSFDHADTPVLGIYIVTATGDVSGRTYSQQQVDLRTPTIATTQTTAGQSSCRAVGLPVGN